MVTDGDSGAEVDGEGVDPQVRRPRLRANTADENLVRKIAGLICHRQLRGHRLIDKPGQELKYETVYNTGNPKDVLEMLRREHGYAYQTHPRTKGSTGYPDAIRDTDYFKDPRYLGSGWKAMPSDLSSPRLGERAFKTIDDMNNLGLRKRMIGEVDVFQLDTTHELYGHMNVNYVRIPAVPSYDNYGQLLDLVANGDYFITTGEILIPDVELRGAGEVVTASATVNYTFPLRIAEIVWGDGAAIHHKTIPLEDTHEFGNRKFRWEADANGWKWARLAVWDVAGNGAFTNPIWRPAIARR